MKKQYQMELTKKINILSIGTLSNIVVLDNVICVNRVTKNIYDAYKINGFDELILDIVSCGTTIIAVTDNNNLYSIDMKNLKVNYIEYDKNKYQSFTSNIRAKIITIKEKIYAINDNILYTLHNNKFEYVADINALMFESSKNEYNGIMIDGRCYIVINIDSIALINNNNPFMHNINYVVQDINGNIIEL